MFGNHYVGTNFDIDKIEEAITDYREKYQKAK